jgi:hypothetical protein
MSKFLSVFQYFPFVVAGVNAVEASMPTAPGTTKKAAILSAIDAAASIGMQVPEAHVQAISAFIDFLVRSFNATGWFTHKALPAVPINTAVSPIAGHPAS